MNLTNDEINFIQLVIKTARLVGINNIIIEPGKVRAMSDEQTVVLFQDTDILQLSCGSLGLNRIDVFLARLEIAKSQDKFEIEAITVGTNDQVGFDVSIAGDTPMWAKSLTMKGKNITIDYRCASPQTIKAPKSRAGVSTYQLSMTPEAINMIAKGKVAMKTDEVSFNGTKNGVSLDITDVNGDTLEYHFTSDMVTIGDSTPHNFSYKYPIDLLLPIFKTNQTGQCSITAKGTLIFNVNGLDVYIMARS